MQMDRRQTRARSWVGATGSQSTDRTPHTVRPSVRASICICASTSLYSSSMRAPLPSVASLFYNSQFNGTAQQRTLRYVPNDIRINQAGRDEGRDNSSRAVSPASHTRARRQPRGNALSWRPRTGTRSRCARSWMSSTTRQPMTSRVRQLARPFV